MTSYIAYEKVAESEHGFDTETRQRSTGHLSRKHVCFGLVVLLLSNLGTWFATEWRTRSDCQSRHQIVNMERSPNAGLARDTPANMHHHSPYNQANETLRDAAWEAINVDAGTIAVPQSFVDEKNLHESQSFVWDREKSVYLINGYHTLHCVRAVYLSLTEFWQGKPQSRAWEHVIHCVDELRQEAMCNADDTLRYSTPDQIPGTGMEQTRMCRSWEKLEDWANQYNACYRLINQTESYVDFPQIERFVWCPEGSPYTKEVEKVFGHIEWDEDGYTISEPDA